MRTLNGSEALGAGTVWGSLWEPVAEDWSEYTQGEVYFESRGRSMRLSSLAGRDMGFQTSQSEASAGLPASC